MIQTKNFEKILTEEGIEILNIDRVRCFANSFQPVFNNTNYENTYYIHIDDKNNTCTLIGREEKVTDIRYELAITKEPIELNENNEAIFNIKELISETIVDFLKLEAIPVINIGDINPYEHGFILVEDIGDEYFVAQIDRDPDNEILFHFLEAVVPKIEDDIYSVLDYELSEYATNIFTEKTENCIPLFFNEI